MAPTAVRTFLIADVRGYTRFTRERGDAAAAMLATRFANLARDAVEARGGHVIGLRGDEALAVFDSAPQAVRAAVEFQATCAEESVSDPEFPLPVGIGLDSGEAVPVEDGYRGAALNMAARLCSNAAAGQVLVTRGIVQATAELDGEIQFAERGPASFKGFEEAVEVVEALAGDPGRSGSATDGASGERGTIPPELDPLTPLVEREAEMRWLRGTWRQAHRGRGRILFISGEAQIGKTRLAAEMAAHVHAADGVVRYAGAGGAATADALAAIRAAGAAGSPLLVVLDDVDVAGAPVGDALLSALDEVADRPVLVLALLRDADAAAGFAPPITRADERGDGHRILAPLDVEGVRGIVQLYAGDDTADAPLESIARASHGVPGRVHEVVSEWARSEASRRLSAAAEFLAAGRDRHASDLEFANNVIGLKLGRLFTVDGRDVAPVETCPYKGLAQFDEADSAYFFGRERLVGELAARTVQSGLLGVVGASGSGKSSVISAGLLPSLQAGLLPGSETWTHTVMRPGEHPMDELVRVLAAEIGDVVASTMAVVPSSGRAVLVVDQFEEVFTVCGDEEERTAFIGALTDAADRPDQMVVVVAIRGDYYAHCAPYPRLAEGLAANHVLVAPLTREELHRTVEWPARRAGLRMESALVDALVDEVADQPGALPLLSTALVELWQARTDGWIRLEALERTGGVSGAVARLAESSYEQLSDAERGAARRVFLRLVATGEGEFVTRRRVSLDEFDVDRDARVAGVIARLTQDRLLTVSENTVEVAHEALLREWPRLEAWLEEDAQGRQLRHHLTQAAHHWDGNGQEDSEVYRGARLSAALDWSATHSGELNDLERRFLAAGRLAGEREAERQRRTNRRLRTLLAGAAALLVIALVAGAVALVQRGSAQRSAKTAHRSATVALAQSLGAQAVSEPRIDLAMLLARESVALDPSVRTRSDLLTTLMRVPTAARTFHWNTSRNLGVAVSRDGRTLAIEDNNGNTVVEDARTGRRIGTLKADVQGFGPDGSLLTAAGGTLTGSRSHLTLRDPSTLKVTRVIALPRADRTKDAVIGGVFFTEGGARMGVAVARQQPSPSGPVTTSQILLQYRYAIGQLAGPAIAIPTNVVGWGYANGGRRLVVVGGRATQVYDARTGHRIRSYPVFAAGGAVSADGSRVAIGGADGSVRFLDTATGRVTLGVGAAAGGTAVMTFTPDGRTLVASEQDGKTLLWNVATHTIRATLDGHAGPIHAQAVSADGSTLYTGSFDTNVVMWDLTGHRGLVPSFVAAATKPGPNYWSLGVSPDGKTLAVGSTKGMVNLWDASTFHKVAAFRAMPGAVSAVAFSPDGRSLLVAGNDLIGPHPAWVRIWRLGPTPRLVRSMAGPSLISWAVWSPDGRTIAATGWNANQSQAGLVTEWDARTGRVLAPPTVIHGGAPFDLSFAPHGTTVAVVGSNGIADVVDPASRRVEQTLWKSVGALYTFGVAFSPDGTTVATTDWNGAVDLVSRKTGRRLGAPIPDPSQYATQSVAFSPDGRTLAVSDAGDSLRLFDVATRREIGPAIQLGEVGTYLAFTPDGSKVVVTAGSGRTWVVPVSLTAWENRACAIANRNLTRSEWSEFLPGVPYRPACPGLPRT